MRFKIRQKLGKDWRTKSERQKIKKSEKRGKLQSFSNRNTKCCFKLRILLCNFAASIIMWDVVPPHGVSETV
jgi:hypothetical protein